MNIADTLWSAAHKVYKSGVDVFPDPMHRINNRLAEFAYARKHKKALPYDDATGEFFGGELERLTSNNYEKALRNLWKAEVVAPFLDFRDASKEEKQQARKEINSDVDDITQLKDYISSEEFERILEEEYTPRQREVLARLLSIIMHGEAYALFTSASLIPVVRGTGPKLGMSMQVVEEAKHFIVMRELIRKIDRVYPHTFWDQLLMENILKANTLDRLFGMNIVLESIAMNFFSSFAQLPGLEKILGFFHMDESRHSAFPQVYTTEAPLGFRTRFSPARQTARLGLILPLIPMFFEIEDLAEEIGIDIFEFGAKCVDKIFRLSERSRFYTPLNRLDALRLYNVIMNGYRHLIEGEDYQGFHDYTVDRTINIDPKMKKLEDEVFGTDDELRGWINKGLEPAKRQFFRYVQTAVSGENMEAAVA